MEVVNIGTDPKRAFPLKSHFSVQFFFANAVLSVLCLRRPKLIKGHTVTCWKLAVTVDHLRWE